MDWKAVFSCVSWFCWAVRLATYAWSIARRLLMISVEFSPLARPATVGGPAEAGVAGLLEPTPLRDGLLTIYLHGSDRDHRCGRGEPLPHQCRRSVNHP
jgi:hypothetical protein